MWFKFWEAGWAAGRRAEGQGGCLGVRWWRQGGEGAGAVCTVFTVGNSREGGGGTPAGGHFFWTASVGQ
jgi:hypothetical protein